jgi:hypothetical protein
MAPTGTQPDPLDPLDSNQTNHALTSSWFLGPRAENVDVLKELFSQALDRQKQTRVELADYHQDGDVFITEEMQQLDIYKTSIAKLQDDTNELSTKLAQHSVPFWSPRYNAHMNMDTTMASIIGYMTTMIYNPNNVATEASPYTTELEKQVGQDLCQMLGYNSPTGDPAPWGHITCDGSVANLEAIWSTRSLMFYPFSLKLAMTEGPLKFLSTVQPPFTVETCNAGPKAFLELTNDELLNLTPATVLALPTRLGEEYSVTPGFLQDALKPYLIQTTGKDAVEKKFKINPGKFMISATKHYSWPKGGGESLGLSQELLHTKYRRPRH